MTGEHTVFVYGTLKLGYGNNRLLTASTFVGQGRTTQPYWMLATGGFPVVFDDRHHHPVLGEIYECDERTLTRLDGLEGHPHWYRRKPTVVEIEDTGIHLTAWMYIGVPTAWNNRDRLIVVAPKQGAYQWGVPDAM